MGQVLYSQALHQTSVVAAVEKEKLLLGLVEKALQRVVAGGEKHSLRRNLPPLQVGEEAAVAALWGGMRIKSKFGSFLTLSQYRPQESS